MKKLVALLALLGITICINAETGKGFVYNDDKDLNSYTIIVRPSLDSAIIYGSDGRSRKIPYTIWISSLTLEEMAQMGKATSKILPRKVGEEPIPDIDH